MNQVGLPADRILEARRGALRTLCRRCHVRRLDLFGSALTDHFDVARSDFDMLVTFDDLAPGPYADAYFALKQGLEDLLGHDVDLVTTPTLENPYFRREVEAHRKTLFSAA
ncbi:MAG TPA: nucleotidyltransferase domain-containing protein [Acetobacteraceae bacterium]|nr:nucleotidyltransferase domain-containing protein [Acetobacteraceae bacterium]